MNRCRMMLLSAVIAISIVPVTADAMSNQCQLLLSLPPTAPQYTGQIITRTKAALADIDNTQDNIDFLRYLPSWTRVIAQSWSNVLDAQLRLDAQQEDLMTHTACLRIDIAQIECLMEAVRDAQNDRLDPGSSFAQYRLKELLFFLHQRQMHLVRGAMDPGYEDDAWYRVYVFDAPNAESLYETPSTPFCPYDSDFAPSTPDGFGCDTDVMIGADPEHNPRINFAPLKAEYDALKDIEQELQTYRDAAKRFAEVQRTLDEIFGREIETYTPEISDEHKRGFGCSWEGGYCRLKPQLRCMRNEECAKENAGECIMPLGVCEKNRVLRCSIDEQCGSAQPCLLGENIRIPPVMEVRGPFSVDPDHLRMLRAFERERMMEGAGREVKNDLKLPNEFPDSQQQERVAREKEQRSILVRLWRAASRNVVSLWSREIGKQEAAIYPLGIDGALQSAEALAPLHASVRDIAKLASDKDGLRDFVLRYAFFLRRSCIYRPCSISLDRIISLVLADACFPYTDGDYLEDDENNPRWKQCADEAEF